MNRQGSESTVLLPRRRADRVGPRPFSRCTAPPRGTRRNRGAILALGVAIEVCFGAGAAPPGPTPGRAPAQAPAPASAAHAPPRVEKAQKPHGDPGRCSACHGAGFARTSTLTDPPPSRLPPKAGRPDGPASDAKDANGFARAPSARDLLFDGDVVRLCESCHDGRRAPREFHPVGPATPGPTECRIPPDLPLKDGGLTCGTCHDIAWRCTAAAAEVDRNPRFLRGAGADPLRLCFRCHVAEKYRPFNAHDQLDEDGSIKAGTCLYCHTAVPDTAVRRDPAAPSDLRSDSRAICSNCHRTTDHAIRGKHMDIAPSAAMRVYMSASELAPRMRLPFDDLVKYVRAAKRQPQSIPLEEGARITCFSCHNPHEKGVLPAGNPRSIGAEPKDATNHRLRASARSICEACHDV